MSDQEQTIAYQAEEAETPAFPGTEEETISEPMEADPEELTDAEYAEIIGEDTEEPEEEADEILSVPAAHEPARPVPRKNKKRRKETEQAQPITEDRHRHKNIVQESQKIPAPVHSLHNIGGADTLKTTGSTPKANLDETEHTDEPINNQWSQNNTAQEDKRQKSLEPATAPSPIPPRHLKSSRPTNFLRDMSRGGSASARAARSYLSGHDTAEQNGERNLRRYGVVLSDTAEVLAAAGGKAEAKQQQFASRQFTEGAVNAEKAIAAGILRREDLLLSKKALREKLKGNRIEQWGIVKNRKAIYDALVVKEELIRLKDTSPDPKHIFARTKVAGRNVIGISRQESKKQVRILTSDQGRFFNDFKYGAWTQNMIAVYFSKHEDPMLRKINPARMRITELKRLLAQTDRYRLKPTDIAMIRTLIRGKSAMRHRQADRFSGLTGSFRTVRAITRRGVRYLEQTDDATAEGYRKLTTVYQGIRTIKPAVHLVGTIGVKTAGAVWHLPPVSSARHIVMKPVQKGTEIAVNTAKAAGQSAVNTVRTITARQIAGAQTGEVVASMATKELVHTTGASGAGVKTIPVKGAIGTAQKASRIGRKALGTHEKRKTGRLSRRMKRLKQNRVIRYTAFIRRRTGSVIHIATAPVRLPLIAFSKLYYGIRKIIASILVLLFAAILLFMLFIMFSAFITSVGNATGEIIEKVVTDDDLAAHIRHLNERNLAKFQEAVDIVKAGPQHDAEHTDSTGRYPDEAYGGEKLYHYGSPKDRYAPDADFYHNDLSGEVPGGFHYIYLDANGQMIGNNTNNTKDIICLTSVMVGNDYDEDTLTLAPALMDVWFDYLNPAPTYTVSELYHKEGTDVFPHEEYTFDGKRYYCTDSDFYTAYEAAGADGVYFYETPAPQTEDGCRTDWTTYWDDYERWWEDRPEYPD